MTNGKHDKIVCEELVACMMVRVVVRKNLQHSSFAKLSADRAFLRAHSQEFYRALQEVLCEVESGLLEQMQEALNTPE
jgi:hypothetical protein